MWNFSKHGYVSIVQKDEKKPDELTVRGRDRRSLEEWCKLAAVPKNRIHAEWPSDYPYRLVASREEVEAWAVAEVRGITYKNFKTEADFSRGKIYHDMLTSIWSITHRLTPQKVQQEMRNAWNVYDAKWRATVKGGKRSIVADQFGFDDDDEPEDHLESDLISLHDLTTDQWNALMKDAP